MKETTLDNSIESKRRRRRALKKTIEKIMNAVFFVCGAAAIAAVALITVYMVVSGLPAIREIGLLDFLFGTEWKSTAAEPKFGILPFILTSIWGTLGAIVIGVPVGFVNVVESKLLTGTCPVPQIVLDGRRGGSALAVTTLHAILENLPAS